MFELSQKRYMFSSSYIHCVSTKLHLLINTVNPFLESHHIVWRSMEGPDILENTNALCPNCHRKIHIHALDEDVK
ncbi:HNH endonuclease signature motif containing protein [Paenibacillus prosopidis]|uniref:HNH endonuclease signature motif containing protein n=1 Tax=Paenibacillus prosopidis TaxID=630520 RepID=UPI00319DA075